MWTDDWLGLPYAELGRGPAYDCLGLFLTLQRVRLGRCLPDPGVTMLSAVRERTAEALRPRFRRVAQAREGDALMFRVAGRLLHVGYALDNHDMLHIETDGIGSAIERWRAIRWASRLEGIYRYND